MSIFQKIDNKLIMLANKLNGSLTKDRSGIGTKNFEERRIDWKVGEIRKAIIIQPDFSNGINMSVWNFINIAWIEKNGIPIKPGRIVKLIDNQSFENVEDNIDELLINSEDYLNKIRIEDLKQS